MAPPTHDAAKHHVGLKEKGSSPLYGFIIDGYRMEMQREAGSASEYGGQSDLIGQAPSVARWTQEDFVGGMFAYDWGKDDAMFADCVGFMSMPQARSLQSVPPLFQKKALDPDTLAGYVNDSPKGMIMVGGSIYTAFHHTLTRYQIDTDTTTTYSLPGSDTFVGIQYESTDQLIYSMNNISGSAPGLRRTKTDLTDPAIDHFYPGPTDTDGQSCYGFTIHDGLIVAQIGRKLYLGDMPDNPSPTVAGEVDWEKITRLPGRWWDSMPYNGMTYILLNDGSFRSQIVAWDGTAVLPICTLPFSFYAKCMIEYAGRIYVGGTGTDVNGGEHYAELYEITGASVRLVRSFSPETRNFFLGGVAGEWPNSFDDLAVFEGMLWMGWNGKKMIAYDVTSDGFFGAAEILSNNDLKIHKMVTGRGRLWAFASDPTSDAGHGIYRIAQPADSIGAWNPTFVSSDFGPEPAMKKRWGKLRVKTRYGSCSSIEYSINSGESWTSLGAPTVTNTYGKVYYSDVDLAAITPSEHIRFRVKLTVSGEAGSAVTYHRELVAFTMSFAMLDTGKWGWSFTIIGADEVETMDAQFDETNTQAQDVSDFRSTLRGYARNKTPLTFRDVDDVEYDVQLVGFSELLPEIANDPSGESQPEALYALTLLEV